LTENTDQLPYLKPPELVAPFKLSEGELASVIGQFSKEIPYPPDDLTPDHLFRRLKKIYLPTWLIDAEVQATWQAEAGFDYQVLSHQDRFDERRGGWVTQEITEGRVRWEPRQGRLHRAYANIIAPALEEDADVRQFLPVSLDASLSQPYRGESVGEAFVRLPNRIPEDAWTEALPAFQSAAAAECQVAAAANHLREFNWSPEFSSQNWTLLLNPLFTSFYLDDEGEIQVVMINGQSGKVSGARRASMKRAQRIAWVVLGVAFIVFLISSILTALGIVVAPALPVGVLGLALSVLIGLGAIMPFIIVWQFNRAQMRI
jgi:hypothetical protein